MHTLTLVVPDLAVLLAARTPLLERMLARGARTLLRGVGPAAWCCARFGVARQVDWPIAALLAAAAGADASRYWLCAQPASLAADRDCVVMLPAPVLSAAEATALFDCISAHIEADGLLALSAAPGHWVIGCDTAQALSCTEPALAVGRNIDALLPRGDDAGRWLRLGTELQMLLHEHPVNLAREERGDAPVNSVWLWGGGRLPTLPDCGATVVTRQVLPRALARAARARVLAPGQDLRATLDAAGDADLIVLPDAGAAAAGGAIAWEQAWLEPAWQCLLGRRFDRLDLAGLHRDGMLELRIERSARWKFWRRHAAALESGAGA